MQKSLRLLGAAWASLGLLVTIVSRKSGHAEVSEAARGYLGVPGLLVMIASLKSGQAEVSEATRGYLGLPGAPCDFLRRQLSLNSGHSEGFTRNIVRTP